MKIRPFINLCFVISIIIPIFSKKSDDEKDYYKILEEKLTKWNINIIVSKIKK